jgi:hypothetical protein
MPDAGFDIRVISCDQARAKKMAMIISRTGPVNTPGLICRKRKLDEWKDLFGLVRTKSWPLRHLPSI